MTPRSMILLGFKSISLCLAIGLSQPPQEKAQDSKEIKNESKATQKQETNTSKEKSKTEGSQTSGAQPTNVGTKDANTVNSQSTQSGQTGTEKGNATQTSGSAATGSGTESNSSVEQAIMQMEREGGSALVKADTAALEQIWADDYSMTNPGGNVTKRADYLGMLKSGDMKFEAVELQDQKITVTGDMAEVSGRVRVKLRFKDEQPVDEVDNYTNTYTKRGDRWQLVSTKVTRPEGQQQ